MKQQPSTQCCAICRQKFKSSDQLKEHFRKTHVTSQKYFPCKECIDVKKVFETNLMVRQPVSLTQWESKYLGYIFQWELLTGNIGKSGDLVAHTYQTMQGQHTLSVHPRVECIKTRNWFGNDLINFDWISASEAHPRCPPPTNQMQEMSGHFFGWGRLQTTSEGRARDNFSMQILQENILTGNLAERTHQKTGSI